MAFDVGAGLAEMGGAIAKTAGTALLEQQKADLDKERIILADELAGKRQDKQNEFLKGERIETQTYQSGEKQKDRELTVSEGALNRASHERTAAMSAGASIQSARIHQETAKMQVEAMSGLRDAEKMKLTLDNTIRESAQTARAELQKAMQANDPAAIDTAKAKIAAIEHSAQDDVKSATLLQGVAKMKEQDVLNAETNLIKLQNATNAAMPDGKAAIEAQQAKIRKLRTDYESSVRAYDEAVKNLPQFNGGGNRKDRTPLGQLPGLNGEVKARATGSVTGAPLLNPPDIDAITRALGGG